MFARFYTLFILVLLSILSNPLAAQIELKLQLIGELKWGVYAKPVGVTPSSSTITASGQVTVVMPAGYQWKNPVSISGLWTTTGGMNVSPSENPTRTYLPFGLVSAEPTHPIVLKAGEETLLFTFEGVDACPDFMYLIDCGTPNQSDPFCPPNSVVSNPGNDLSVIDFEPNINYYNFKDIYAPHAWDCKDNDGDGYANGLEDTNGNGEYDPEDISDLNDINSLPLEPGFILKLQLIAENRWGVFAKPHNISIDSVTVTASGQVTLVMPNGYNYVSNGNYWAGSLTSVSGLWTASGGAAYSPAENPAAQYISVGLVTAEPTHPITLKNGEETLLFTFKGDGTCPEFMYLIDCQSPNGPDPFCAPNSINSNPVNDLTLIEFDTQIEYHHVTGIYSHHAWDCHDCDNDGILNAFEDTNGSGVFDAGDASDMCDACSPLPDIIYTMEPAQNNIRVCAGNETMIVACAEVPNGEFYFWWEYSLDNGATWDSLEIGNLTQFDHSSNGLPMSSGCDTFFIHDATYLQYYWYRAMASKTGCLDKPSSAAKLVVEGPLSVAMHPENDTLCSGDPLIIDADIINLGDSTVIVSYQWQASADDISFTDLANNSIYGGCFTKQLLISDVTGLHQWSYRLRAEISGCDYVYTNPAQLFVEGPITMNEQPQDVTNCPGGEVLFLASITNPSDPLRLQTEYQWEILLPNNPVWQTALNGYAFNGINIMGGANSDTFLIVTIDGLHGAKVRMKAWTGMCDTIVSDEALILVENDISFVSHSGDVITCGGEPGLVTATFEQNDGSQIPIYYQWQISADNGLNYGDVFNGSAYQGTDTDSLLIINTSNLNGYRCRLKAWTGTCDTLYSPYSLIKINNPLTVYQQPVGIQACEDDEVFFTVGVDDPIDPSGSQIQYQWEILIPNSTAVWQPLFNGTTFNGINTIGGQNSDTLLITPLTGLNGAYVRAVAWKDNCDPVISDPALIDLSGTIRFTTQPQDVLVCSGDAFCFTVEAEYLNGGGNFNYQWEYSISANPGTWIVIVNPTQLPNMTINGNQLCFSSPQDVNQYKFRAVVWSNQCSDVNSQMAEVNVGGIFSVVENPLDAEACAGDEVLFSAKISAPALQGPVNYQWQYSLNGIDWADATASIFEGTITEELLITDVTGMDGWHFRLQGYSNNCDPVYSESAVLKLIEEAICNPKHVELSIKYFPSTPASSYWGVFLKAAPGFDPTGDNVLTSGEVTIAASQGFIYKNLTSHAGGMWKAGAAYITLPGQTGLNYFSFVLTPNSNPLNLTHEEVMLFSFSKKEDCPDELFLIDDVYPNGIHPNTITGNESGNSPDEYFSLGGYYESEMGGCGGMTKDPEDPNETTTNFTGNTGSGNTELSFEPSIEQPAFQFAPNPADEIVDIRFSAIEKDAEAFLLLVNVQGQVLKKQPLLNANELRLDLTTYTSGMYFLLLQVDGEIKQEGKLVKR